MTGKKKSMIREATRDDEKALLSVTRNEADIVEVRGRKFVVRWMHPATADWITHLMSKEGNDNKVISQCSALIVLNGFWKSHLLYWFLWRWFYYIKQYNASELMPLVSMAQKKTAQEEVEVYLNVTILLTALSTGKKQMTKAEAERILQGHYTAKDGKLPKNTE